MPFNTSFKPHPEIEGRHAFLSPSKYAWIRYDEDKLLERFDNHMDAALGTRLHNLAAELIRLGQKLEATHQTLNLYVNDCIGYRMRPEQPLKYSDNAFGTADAIWFGSDPEDPTGPYVLRIFDLKNGTSTKSEAYEDQLMIYAAFFCLEYGIRPGEITYDLRIYQNDEIVYFDPDPLDIANIMEWTQLADALVAKRKEVM